MTITFVVSDTSANLLLYTLVQANIPANAFIENTTTKSFAARADALAQWFLHNYLK
jgi:hypothetical protein